MSQQLEAAAVKCLKSNLKDGLLLNKSADRSKKLVNSQFERWWETKSLQL